MSTQRYEGLRGRDLVQLIVCLATQRGAALTRIRTVKFLYLLDHYYARRGQGTTATGWCWEFAHFGPFCAEALQALSEAVVADLVRARACKSRYSDDEHVVYTVANDAGAPADADLIPTIVVSELKQAIGKWANDTPGLLSYVCFETEPMMYAQPFERLSFSMPVVH